MSKPIQVEVVLSHSEHLPAVDVWLVVDVLRASTVMVHWFDLGGAELCPTASVEDARSLAERLAAEGDARPLLMGERNAIAPLGFDLGNSPLDLTRELVRAHPRAVMATTNGTKALLKAASTGTPVLVACARNAFAALDLALSKGRRIGILCAGRKGRPAWDDTLCAGLLIARLTTHFPDVRLADSARLAHLAWLASGAAGASSLRSSGFASALATADHAVFLDKIGYAADIAFAAEIDAARSVPELHEDPDEGGRMRAVLRDGSPAGGGKSLVLDYVPLPEPEVPKAVFEPETSGTEEESRAEEGELVFFPGEGYKKHRGAKRKN